MSVFLPQTGASLLLALAALPAFATEGWYRDPALHGDTVVFTAEGDLWRVSAAGGLAQRLSTHPAEESQAAISPDGRTLAFVANYEGTPEVYAMPLAGGEPKRLSFEGARVWVQGFAPDGRVVYAGEGEVGPSSRRVLRLVDIDSGRTETLPLADAREAAFDAERKQLWFTRFGLQVTADNARDYRGGAAAQLWRWSLGSSAEAERFNPAGLSNPQRPLFHDGGLVLLGESAGRYNLWQLDVEAGAPRQLTRHADFDVRRPSLHNGRVVYQHGADLRLLELASGSDRVLDIQLGSDLAQRRERHVAEPLKFLQSAHLGPDGVRVALAARGQVLLAGTEALRRITLAAPAGARLREAVVSKDGREVFAITDLDGRSEIWRYPADGSPGGRALTTDGDTHRFHLYPSPDGQFLAHDDKQGRLHLLDLRSGASREIDQSEFARDDAFAQVAWSADSRLLAVLRVDSARQINQLVLLEPASGRKQTLTSDRYETVSAAFSRDGAFLYFLANRSFQSSVPGPWGDRNTGAFFDRRTRLYALALDASARFPFQPANELDPPAPPKDEKEKNKSEPSSARLDWDGIAERLFEAPLGAGNYSQLAADDSRLYYLERDSAPNSQPALKSLSIGNAPPKPDTFAAGIAGYALSADAKKILLLKNKADNSGIGELLIVDAGAKAPDDLSRATLKLSDWRLPIDPPAEWQQMFDDAWRMHRQFSFDPGMRGVDWVAVRTQYSALLPRVQDRLEFDDLLAQMAAEVGLLHSQIRGGDIRVAADAPVPAALGARFAEDDAGLRIERIYRSDPELPSERSPLAQPGVDAREGDRLIAVNGRPVQRLGELAQALNNQAGQQVLLSLQRGSAAAHRSVVLPVKLDREAALRYSDWVEGLRARVDGASQGRIGYLHLRAMGAGDMAGFVRDFYAQFDREGLIIDVRRNRGGNIDSWVIEKLLRRAWAFWQPPRGTPYANMQQTFRGHLVVLADALTYSDGETFAAGVKSLQLGPVIGTRTAGAGIWLSDRNRLADGGAARIAEFGQFEVGSGRWLIEGQGVAPDIEVDNLPYATYAGGDAQLEAAIANLQQRLQQSPLPALRAAPIPPRGTPGHDGSR
ncbi:S41 family peptidase [Aquimonas sp.]|jgi:tricorn protease|uniref:S41 family peptidase n=1 Tax=Aquimonas sp. TaxID=1872588 RepID=UPI0037C1530E